MFVDLGSPYMIRKVDDNDAKAYVEKKSCSIETDGRSNRKDLQSYC